MENFNKIGQTSRILVRAWVDTDADAWFQLSQDEGINKFSLSGYRLSDVNASQAMIKVWTEGFRKIQLGVLPIILKATSEIVGICALKPAKLDDEPTDQIEIMYRLGQKYWKQGFATEAGKILLQYGFGQLDLPSVIGFILPENIPSRAVLLRLDMKFIRNSTFSKHQVELYRVQKKDFFKKNESE